MNSIEIKQGNIKEQLISSINKNKESESFLNRKLQNIISL